MAIADIRDVLKACSPGSPAEHGCGTHPGRPAWGICSECGRNLCGDCFIYFERRGFCPRCGRRAAALATQLGPWVTNPAAVFLGLIVFFSALYVVFGRSDVGAAIRADEKTAAKALARRNWFYMSKAVRLKQYADYVRDRGKDRMAARSSNRARLALEEVVEGTKAQLSQPSGLDESAKERLAGLLVCIADCYRGEGKTSEAFDTLQRGLGAGGPPETTGLACYRLGRIYEEDMEKYEEAVSMYERAQTYTVQFTAFIEGILAGLAKQADDRGIDAAVEQLAGSYDRAEAQYRIILCWQKMGLPDKVKEAQQALVNGYPRSEWAREVIKATGMKPEFGGFRPFGDGVKTPETPEKKKEEERETLTIVPLEE